MTINKEEKLPDHRSSFIMYFVTFYEDDILPFLLRPSRLKFLCSLSSSHVLLNIFNFSYIFSLLRRAPYPRRCLFESGRFCNVRIHLFRQKSYQLAFSSKDGIKQNLR